MVMNVFLFEEMDVNILLSSEKMEIRKMEMDVVLNESLNFSIFVFKEILLIQITDLNVQKDFHQIVLIQDDGLSEEMGSNIQLKHEMMAMKMTETDEVQTVK